MDIQYKEFYRVFRDKETVISKFVMKKNVTELRYFHIKLIFVLV